MKNLILLCLSILLTTFIAVSQDTLVLTNGKIKTNIEFLGVDSIYVHYKNLKKDNNQATTITKELVYAVVKQENIQIITYLQNEDGTYILYDNMLEFLDGFMTSKRNYRNYPIFVTGFVVGASSGIFLPTTITPIPPILFPGIIGAFKPDVTKNKHFPLYRADDYYLIKSFEFGAFKPDIIKNKHCPLNITDDYYFIKGFEYGVKRTSLRSAALGSVSGFATGFLINVFLLK